MSDRASRQVACGLSRSSISGLPTMAAVLLCLMASSAVAEVKSVSVRIDEPKAWVGQRVPFFVELRAAGSFADSASFDLPRLPGVIVMKIGNPVVGTQQLEGQSWIVQTHEFALFSQRSGTLVVPEFTTRFARRDDFVGPVNDVQAKCPSFSIEIERPPDSEGIPFLITTESMEVSESWEPTPSDAEVGAVFKRTIVQRAEQLPGMAFAPISSVVPEGIRFYAGQATVNDQLERGDFIGERRETVTYLLQRPGTYELPELNFVSWNPKTKSLESKTLPSVRLFATTTPVSEPSVPPSQFRSPRWPLMGLASLIAVSLLILLQQRLIRQWLQELKTLLNPPEQIAARRLQHACRTRNPTEASAAWYQWSCSQETDFIPIPTLTAAVVQMQRSMFGPTPGSRWNGDELRDAFREQRSLKVLSRQERKPDALPTLNP